jgi:AcrR family transcriptional regulator
MRSVDQQGEQRILTAAIDLFGRQGFDGTSVRQLADSAAVSPALVIHHFGSKVGLREACDEHVLSFLKSERANVLLGTVDFDSARGYLAEHPEVVAMSRYLSQALARGDLASRQLFNRLIDDARDNLVLGEQRGMIRTSADPEARAAVLVAWSAGLRLFGDLVA